MMLVPAIAPGLADRSAATTGWDSSLGVLSTPVSRVIHYWMTNVSIRDLRNHGGEIVQRVEQGESVQITRDGRPVAELRSLGAQRLTLPAILERFRTLPAMDPEALRRDIDSVVDMSF